MSKREEQSIPESGVLPVVRESDMVALAEELVASASDRGIALTGEGGLLTALTRQVWQSALEAEMAAHLGYDKHDPMGQNLGNSRNGTTPKTVTTEIGKVTLDVPRDRAGTFEPQIVAKHQRRLSGFDEAVISLYAKGMTTGDIAAHLAEVYDTEVHRDTVWAVRAKVTEDMKRWSTRPLDPIYPVVIIDAIVLKVREGNVANRPVYVAMGVSLDGFRDVLGMWIGPSGGEGAKQWINMGTDLKNRGILDACIVCCEGLKGLRRGDQRRLASSDRANVCGASGPQQSALFLQATLAAHHRPTKKDLHSPLRRGRRDGVRGLHRALAKQVPRHDQAMGIGLARVRAVLGLPTRSAQADLHNQRNRIVERTFPGRHQTPWALPRRTISTQSPLPRSAQPREKQDKPHRTNRRMEKHPQRPIHDLRRPPRNQLADDHLHKESDRPLLDTQ